MSGRAAWKKVDLQVFVIRSAYEGIRTNYARFCKPLFFPYFQTIFSGNNKICLTFPTSPVSLTR